MAARSAWWCAFLIPGLASADPLSFVQAGRLLDGADIPVDGTVPMRMSIHAAAAGGVPVWLSNNCPVAVKSGHFSVSVGDTCTGAVPLDSAVLDAGPRWLELEVNGVTLAPRQALAAVPLAVSARRALVAESVSNTVIAALDQRYDARYDPRYARLQTGTPTPQTGSLSVSDEVRAARFSGDGTGLTRLDAGQLDRGVLDPARLPATVPLLGSNGQLPASTLPTSVPLLGSGGLLPESLLPATLATRAYVEGLVGTGSADAPLDLLASLEASNAGSLVVTSSGIIDGFGSSSGIDTTLSTSGALDSTSRLVTNTVLQSVSQAFAYTGGEQTFVVPSTVTQLTVRAWGGGGGGKLSTNHSYGGGRFLAGAGAGGFARGAYSVSPGETLKVVVGQGGRTSGAGGWSAIGTGGAGGGGCGADCVGGGGGGASGLLRGTTRVLVAGGGGGGGNGGGGGGGGGSSGGTVRTSYSGSVHFGGGGGTQAAVGASGVCSDCDGSNGGAPGSGGNGGSGQSAGHMYPTGGGGGGYFGGGGGGSDSTGGGPNVDDIGGGGGGGSGYVGAGGESVLEKGGDGTSSVDTGGTAAGSTESAYISGIGAGGRVGVSGGDGRVILSYLAPGSTATPITLVSRPQTWPSAPSELRTAVLVDPLGGSLVWNTDVRLSVSRNGGTTWTQAALAEGRQRVGDARLLVATVNVAAQPVGSSVVWKLETSTAPVRILGLGVFSR